VLLRTVVVALLMTAATVVVFLWEYVAERAKGVAPDLALAESQTIAVTTIIVFQCFYLLNCRSLHSLTAVGLFSNNTVFWGIAGVLSLQLAFIYVPWLNSVFGSAPLNLDAWVKAIVVAAIILPAIVLEKRVDRALVRRAMQPEPGVGGAA
jgi:magnesium-transporting ATPase (P-type)